MKRTIWAIILIQVVRLAWGQSSGIPPRFEAADVHPSAKTPNQLARIMPILAGRWEIKNATMVDLIHIAYGFDGDKILDGPSWLELDRFDMVAKVPPDTTAETQKLMLQSLLVDRFQLANHKDTRPLPAYALTAGKKPQLKPADGSQETGCRMQAGSPVAGGMTIRMGQNVVGAGNPTTINLGPGGTIQYKCQNMSMAKFAEAMHGMLGVSLNGYPVVDNTGLSGTWNFDLRLSMTVSGGPANDGPAQHITLAEAIDKQLGLKLEEKPLPTPVMIVDKALRQPTPNRPDLDRVLPPIPVPTEFEVASVKSGDPNARGGRFQLQTGGRLTVENMLMRVVLRNAFTIRGDDNLLVGWPAWVDSERVDIIAKAPAVAPDAPPFDMETVAPMLRKLLADRYKLAFHTEERPVSAYRLSAGKPKMKKADPTARTLCKSGTVPAGAPPATRVLVCQNITMDQFADKLQGMTTELRLPVLNATEIEGSWDFTLTFSQSLLGPGGGGRGGEAGQTATVSDPTGGYTIFEAVEKQLGLKLELQKRPMPVTVIDHMEQKPAEN